MLYWRVLFCDNAMPASQRASDSINVSTFLNENVTPPEKPKTRNSKKTVFNGASNNNMLTVCQSS